MSTVYRIKGKTMWNHHMFHGQMKILQDEMNSLIGIPVNRMGTPVWMSYTEAREQGMLIRKPINQGPTERVKGIIEQIEEGDTRTPEERKDWEERVDKFLDYMLEKHGAKPRDIDKELRDQILKAEREGKQLIVGKKRYRHE